MQGVVLAANGWPVVRAMLTSVVRELLLVARAMLTQMVAREMLPVARAMLMSVGRELLPVARAMLLQMVARELVLQMVDRELLMLARLLVAMPKANLTNDGPCRSPIF